MNLRKAYDLVNALDHLLSAISQSQIRAELAKLRRTHGDQLRSHEEWISFLDKQLFRHRQAHQNRPCSACQALREDVKRLETIVQPNAYCWDARCSHPAVTTHPHLIVSKYRTL